MERRDEQARALDALAGAAPTLAEAQALQARADRLRRAGRRFGFALGIAPLFRN